MCKHIVKITPIKFKNGYPSEEDMPYTKINFETGEIEIIKQLDTKINDVNVTTELKPNSSFPLDHVEIKKSIHRQKELGLLNKEYFPTEYDYKFDQNLPGVIRLKGRPDTSIKEDEITD